MAKAVILAKTNGTVKKVTTLDYSLASVTDQKVNSKVIDKPLAVKSVKDKNYAITKIEDIRGTVKVSQELPFRVKFINIGIESYGPNYVPPIGIAVVGVNNYIL